MNQEPIDFDDLYNETRKIAFVEKKKKTIETTTPLQTGPKLYLDPENWTRGKAIAIIHQSTNTLIGNFVEYLHNKVPSCRKLIREDTPVAVSATEYVEGSWWLGESRRPEPAQVWHEKRQCILHLYLEELKVHAPICELTAHLSYGGLARVELTLDTRFAQSEGPEKFLDLPAGTNVLEVMGLEMKLTLRKELGL